MIKLEALESFRLQRFDEIKNLVRAGKEEKGFINKNDTFECEKDLADYLLGENPLKKAVVKVIEVEPIKENKEEPKIIETIETSVGTFGYGPVEVKTTKPKKATKKKLSKK